MNKQREARALQKGRKDRASQKGHCGGQSGRHCADRDPQAAGEAGDRRQGPGAQHIPTLTLPSLPHL